ncbi:hypothetical protein V5799_020555 [Amblyomma americanum]|uniref:Uncharacterized protein n=1 Tax=Amblyomma americanum TaxID=6943 RepID=A0AAQ4EU05_AMBAM
MYGGGGGPGNPGNQRATAPGAAMESAAPWPPQRPPMGHEGNVDDDQMRRDGRRHGSRRHRDGDNVSTSNTDNGVNVRRYPTPGYLVTVWAFCFVSIATLAVPVGFFLLPFIKASFIVYTQQVSVSSQIATGPSTAATTLMTTAAATTSAPPTTEAPRPTGTSCQKESPNVPGGINLTDVFHERLIYPEAYPEGGRNQPVYCIYNMTRFRRPKRYYFLPPHLPFALCPNIVYWSWRLPRGNLTSRAKEFDERFGLSAIHEVARNQRSRVDLSLALGGYREDSGDFHAVGKDDTVRHRLVQEVYQAYRRYNLSGIVLHWVANEPVCETAFGGSVPRLGEFIDSLRRLMSLNEGSPPFKVAAMVDPQQLHEMQFFRLLRTRLNMTFFKTHQASPSKDFDDYCANSANVFRSNVERVKPFFRPPIPVPNAPEPQKYEGLCISLSLALNARQGYRLEQPAPPQPVSTVEGYMALFEACDSQLSFNDVVDNRPGCVLRKTSGPNLNVTYALDDLAALKTKMSNLGNRTQLCVLIYDIDFDNYMNECRQNVVAFSRYLMLRHFYCARVDTVCFNVTHYLP